MEIREGVPSSGDVDKIIEDMASEVMERMKIPEYDRFTEIETYPVGEDGDFICMISFRGEVIGSVLLYENRIVSTCYLTEEGRGAVN